MASPRTLADLRAGVVRVLAARGEPADALRVTVAWGRLTLRWHVTVVAVVCGVEYGAASTARTTKADAIGDMWRAFVCSLEGELAAAKRSRDATRDPVRREAAWPRVVLAERALAAARAVEGEAGGG